MAGLKHLDDTGTGYRQATPDMRPEYPQPEMYVKLGKMVRIGHEGVVTSGRRGSILVVDSKQVVIWNAGAGKVLFEKPLSLLGTESRWP